jgi:hypothetical protein
VLSARYVDDLAGDEAGVFGREERDNARDVFRLADPAEGERAVAAFVRAAADVADALTSLA